MSSAAIKINEVMVQGDEWIELYNNGSSELELVNWTFYDGENYDNFTLNISAGGFALVIDNALSCTDFSIANKSCMAITQIGNGLGNTGDEIYLYDNDSTLLDNFNWSSSTAGESWQYCSWNWTERISTPGGSNNCTVVSSGSPTNTTENETELDLDWDEDDIINEGEDGEFEIEIEIENMESVEYDIKIWIEDDDENKINDRYDSGEDEWKSGNYYVNRFFEGPGDDSRKIKLRIRDDYKDFEGSAIIYARLRENDGSTILTIEADIDILEPDEDDEDDSDDTNTTTSTTTSSSSDGAISLGGSSSDSSTSDISSKSASSIIYKSTNEYIKEYAIYGFCLLCVGLIVLLLIDRK